MIDVSSRWTHMWKSSKEVDRWRWIMDIPYPDVSNVVMVSSMSRSFLRVTSDTFWSSQKGWSYQEVENMVRNGQEKSKTKHKNTCRERSVDSTSLWHVFFLGGAFDLNQDDFVILRRSCGSVQAPDAQDLFRSQRKAGWIVDLKGYRQGDKRLFFSLLRFYRCKIYI